MLPVNPFKEWVTLYFLHTRCTNSVLPFTAKSGMEGRMKMKEKWKHSIQKWNGFPNWYYCGFLTYTWKRLRTATSETTHEVCLAPSCQMLQLRCSIPSKLDNASFLFQDKRRLEHIKSEKLDVYIFVLRMDKWLRTLNAEIKMKESACIRMCVCSSTHNAKTLAMLKS